MDTGVLSVHCDVGGRENYYKLGRVLGSRQYLIIGIKIAQGYKEGMEIAIWSYIGP